MATPYNPEIWVKYGGVNAGAAPPKPTDTPTPTPQPNPGSVGGDAIDANQTKGGNIVLLTTQPPANTQGITPTYQPPATQPIARAQETVAPPLVEAEPDTKVEAEPEPEPKPAPEPERKPTHTVVEKPSEGDYKAAKRVPDGQRTLDQDITVHKYENHPGDAPEIPARTERKTNEPPKYVSFKGNYANAYQQILAMREAYGDTPEKKAKRDKAKRAAKAVAALADVMAALANMWGATRGATAAKQTSLTAHVTAAQQAEEAAALKRAEQYTKQLDNASKADREMEKILNRNAIEQWKELNRQAEAVAKARDEGNLKAYEKKYEQWLHRYRDMNKGIEDIRSHHNRMTENERNNAQRHQNTMQEIRERGKYGKRGKGSKAARRAKATQMI